MATRQEIQIALDLIKHVNVPNDLFLSTAVSVAKGEIPVTNSISVGGSSTNRAMTITEKKEQLNRTAQNVVNYQSKITAFLSTSEKKVMAENGLNALGVNLVDLENDIQSMGDVAIEVKNKANKATTETELFAIADYIEQNVAALPLVRKG